VLALVGEVMGLLGLEELIDQLPRALREAVPADWCAINELPADLPRTVSVTDPPVPQRLHQAFARYGHQNPLVQHFRQAHRGGAMRFSDLITRRELRELDLYREVYKPLRVEYQIAVTLPSTSERLLGIALSRGGKDFTVTERDLLNIARPYLIQVYRNAIAYSTLAGGAGRRILAADLRALGLTARQAEVMRLVAMGRSAQDAATELGIGVRTAQKHLERCYRTLHVENRSQAAQIAWQAAGA
jgi:DNA-binding CsgD family transcriptional regulator